ncbi:MAG: glycosyltransferase family 39 protein [Armatimonadota bacterium]|nr:glycosyltransferase family 39 protein [Armatimonadota bacterium]
MAGLALLAVALRLVVAAATVGLTTPPDREPAADSRIHAALVASLLRGHGFALNGEPTSDTPPLYVAFLAIIYGTLGNPAAVRIVQALLGGAAVVFLYAFCARIYDRRTALVAAAVLAAFPHAVYVSGLHLTENLFLVLITAALVLSTRLAARPRTGTALALGGLLGLTALTRAVFLTFLPLVVLWAWGTWGWRSPQAHRTAATVLGAAVAVLMPWVARNYMVFHAVIPVQGNGGVVFWAANNPQADGGLIWPSQQTWRSGSPPDDGRYGWRALSLAEENRVYVQAALRWIRSHPADFGRLVLKKLARLYGFSRAEDGRGLRVPPVVRIAHGGVLAAAAAGLVTERRRWRPLLFVLLLVVFTHLSVAVFSGASRYLLPLVPALAVLAAVTVVRAGGVLAQGSGLRQMGERT